MILSLLVGLLLVVPTVWAGLIVTTYHQARSNYNDRAYADAARDFDFAGRIAPDFVVGWRGDYGHGTSLLKLGETDDGVTALRAALEDVPKDPEDAPVNPVENLTDECKVRMNLAVGLERQGDALYEAQNFSAAEAKYLEASEVVAQCVPQGPEPEEQKQDTDEKAEDAQEQQSGEGEGGEGEGEGEGGEGEGGEGEGEGEGEGQGGEGEGEGQGGEGEGQGGGGGSPGPPDGTGGKGQELWQRNQGAEELHRQKRDPGSLGDWDGENW